jgi:phosphomannomutase/phosphoglucomutase
MDLKEKLQDIEFSLEHRHTNPRLLLGMGAIAALMIMVALWLAAMDFFNGRAASEASSQGQRALSLVADAVQSLQRVLDDDQVQQLAARAIENPDATGDLEQYLSGRVSELAGVSLFGPSLAQMDPAGIGPNGFAIMDMLLIASAGPNAPLQLHGNLTPPMMFDAVQIGSPEQPLGYLVIAVDPSFVLSKFDPDASGAGFLRLTQYNGRQALTSLKEAGDPAALGSQPETRTVPGSLFRVEFPQHVFTEFISTGTLLFVLLFGSTMLAVAFFLFRSNKDWQVLHEKDKFLAEFEPDVGDRVETAQIKKAPMAERAVDEETPQTEPPPMRLRYDIAERHHRKKHEETHVELIPGIFRAYDIRGVVGKSLDAGVAKKVGQALGTLVLDKEAGPMVIARDGRLSGPDLVEGMIEGIVSTGCDVLDIGAVPTGVLYYAAFEMAAGSGVMITGSHNPPDYNGFKVMVGGDTLFGEQISDLYRRIKQGEIRTGEGEVQRKDVVQDYIDRIAQDIQHERPLRVVIDCGNGIGGVCAAEVLRAVGAEVLPLFDEVDGTFPNHHPDPSDPENLKDLIESVRLMDADLGLALDGDADRLGVVTLGGSIIYADRVMMLLAMDVLDRNPGATIIYDVKCTGHLATVIREAGGNPVMYKTGHSLIKARMKEIGSPFAGEMSGHFFFKERWYGVDDGIYAAARLLEILAGTEQPPEAILNALPSSFSTPELKVEMEEGENHDFIGVFQSQARFEDAQISTIDGLRADFEDGWGLVRASNTTPILVVRFDAETPEALERIKADFRKQMLALNPDLDLPF